MARKIKVLISWGDSFEERRNEERREGKPCSSHRTIVLWWWAREKKRTEQIREHLTTGSLRMKISTGVAVLPPAHTPLELYHFRQRTATIPGNSKSTGTLQSNTLSVFAIWSALESIHETAPFNANCHYIHRIRRLSAVDWGTLHGFLRAIIEMVNV